MARGLQSAALLICLVLQLLHSGLVAAGNVASGGGASGEAHTHLSPHEWSVSQVRAWELTNVERIFFYAQPPKLEVQSVEDLTDPHWWRNNFWREAGLVTLNYFALLAIFAMVYRHYYPRGELYFKPGLRTNGWSTGIIDCIAWLSEPGICLMAMCCPSVRYAETVSVAGIQGFWPAFTMWFVSSLLMLFPCGGPLTAVLSTFDRNRMRIKFGMPEAGRWTMAKDCCCFMCCNTCILAQEARHVEAEARRQGIDLEVGDSGKTDSAAFQ